MEKMEKKVETAREEIKDRTYGDVLLASEIIMVLAFVGAAATMPSYMWNNPLWIAFIFFFAMAILFMILNNNDFLYSKKIKMSLRIVVGVLFIVISAILAAALLYGLSGALAVAIAFILIAIIMKSAQRKHR
ncbi:MAG: hypothetical protein QXU98_09290 [Candidatus Parvarchaeota archaeon]